MRADWPLVSFKHVSYREASTDPILLDKVTLDFYRGSIVGLASDYSGETTAFLQILANRVNPNAGVVTFFSERGLKGETPHISASWSEKGFFPDLSLFDNLFFNVRLKWGEEIWGKKALRDRAEKLYRELGFELNWYPACHHVPSSDRAVALIVRAFLCESQLYIFDRTFDELREEELLRIGEYLQRLAHKGVTSIVSSGNLYEMMRYCTHVGLFSNGSISFWGKTQELELEKAEYYLVNSPSNAKLLFGKELIRFRHQARAPILFMRQSLDLLSILLKQAPMFYLYRDLSQDVHFFCINISQEIIREQIECKGKEMFSNQSSFASVINCGGLRFDLYPLMVDDSLVQVQLLGEVFGFIGIVWPFQNKEFPIEAFIEECQRALCSLLWERDVEVQVKHRQRLDSLGLLAGGVAHDFNNSLCALMGAAQLIQKRNSNPELERHIDLILLAAKSAQGLTRKLLSFSQKGGRDFQDIDLHEIIQEGVSLLTSGVAKKVQVDVELNACDALMVGDAEELKNIILNLGLNAVQAVDPQKGQVVFATKNVRQSHELNSDWLSSNSSSAIELTVTDNGPGIPAGIIDRIFEPFFSTKLSKDGHGLGLSVVYGSVKEHKGTIRVSNTVNGGAQFSLCFPVLLQDVFHDSSEMVEEVIADNVGHGCILICDDDERVRFTLVAMLEMIGYSVMATASGRECLDVFRAHCNEIDMVLLDDLMPVMGGRECFYQLKTINPDVKVMIISGFRQSENIVEMQQNGLMGVLPKPILLDELATSLKCIVS
ncbi:MAG: response regulator [Nitrospira sp.]|nr:response regulator [Nitrospira sp.]